MRRILKIFPSSILTILLLALVLRLPHLSGSLWLDEAAQALESARPFSEQLNIRDDFQPPLLHLITFFSIRVHTSEWWLRLWGALIPGVLTVVATYKIAQLLHDKRAAVLSSALLATSSFHIFYSQELRPYALPALWAMISSYALLRQMLAQQPQQRWWVVYAAATIAGLYSSYLYPFLLFAHVCWILVRPQLVWWYLGSTVIAICGFLPWLPSFLEQLSAGSQVRSSLPGWESVVSIPQLKSVPLVLAKFVFGVLPVDLSVPFIVFTGIIVLLTLYLTISIKQKRKQTLVILLLWLVVPVITAWLVSFVVPVVQPKRVLFLLPVWHMFISTLIVEGFKKPNIVPFFSVVLLSFVFSIQVFSIYRYWSDPKLQRENWRERHQHILEQYPAYSAIAVFSFPAPFAPWTWYDDGHYPTISTGTLTTSSAENLPDTLKIISNKRYVLVFDYLRDLTDPHDAIPATLESLGYTERAVIDYPNIGFVRVFAQNNSVLGALK